MERADAEILAQQEAKEAEDAAAVDASTESKSEPFFSKFRTRYR